MERRDLLDILDSQDSIADVTQDIAELADQRSMHLPPALVQPFTALAERTVEACEQGKRIIDELDELVETGFGDREVALVRRSDPGSSIRRVSPRPSSRDSRVAED